MLVPCLNSSLEFILVSGLRFAILTPSFAFLLWALEKIPVSSILKCSNISTSILPPCFSLMCFQRGLSAAFFWTSATYSSPLLKRFLPDSPAYSELIKASHRMQIILYPTPVLLQTPTWPVLQGKHFCLLQCSIFRAPGCVVLKTWPSCLPPLSWMLREIPEFFSSSSQAFFNAFASAPSGVGGIMMTPFIALKRKKKIYLDQFE